MTKETELPFSVWGCKKLYKASAPANQKLTENGSHLSSHLFIYLPHTVCYSKFATFKVVVIIFQKGY